MIPPRPPSNSTLLPDDWVREEKLRARNRTWFVLCIVVIVFVIGAFLVTNRQWAQVAAEQQAVNQQFEDAAEKIAQLEELEQKRELMMQKAQLTEVLVERVPRSILMADLINRMPERLSLLEFAIKSEEIKVVRQKDTEEEGGNRSLRNKPQKGKTKADVKSAARPAVVEMPKLAVTISLTGAAPNDFDVSRFMAQLRDHPLYESVRLDSSEQKDIDGHSLRQFKMTLRLRPDADVRRSPDAIARRPVERDPMNDTIIFGPGELDPSAIVPDTGEESR